MRPRSITRAMSTLYLGDDDLVNARALALVFGDDANVRTARDGAQIVRLVEETEPDVIVIDERVVPSPEMLLQWLRALPNARFARIAVVRQKSARLGDGDERTLALYRAGADLVIDSTGGRFAVLRWLMLLGPNAHAAPLN